MWVLILAEAGVDRTYTVCGVAIYFLFRRNRAACGFMLHTMRKVKEAIAVGSAKNNRRDNESDTCA